MNGRQAGAAVLVTLLLALTGCSRGAAPVPAPASPPAVTQVVPAVTQVATAAAPSAGASAADTSTLDGISKDLDAADGANSQTVADQNNAEQAAATADD